MKHTNRNKPVDLRDGVETMVEIKVGNIYPTVSCGDVELLEHNNYNDIKVGDQLEIFDKVEVKVTL